MNNINVYITLLFLVSSKFVIGQFSTTTINTPNGTQIEALAFNGSDWTQQQIQLIEDQIEMDFPNVTIVGNATKTYNCHGYAWYISEGGSPNRWVNEFDINNDPNLELYWEDGSYGEVCSVNEGSKIHYHVGDHSAISSFGGNYQSKWGAQSLVRHSPTDVPSIYSPSNRKYYKKMNWNINYGEPCGSTIQYSVSPISGASYSWDSDDILSGGGSSSSATFTKVNNGLGWVEVDYSYSGCSTKTSRYNHTVKGIIGGTVNQSGTIKNMVSTMGLTPGVQAVIYLSYLPNPSSISVSKISGNGSWSYNSSNKTLYLTLSAGNSIQFNISGTSSTCGSLSRNVIFYAGGYYKEKNTPIIYDSNDIQNSVSQSREGNSVELHGKINIFPNPMDDMLFIDSEINFSNYNILDVSGKLVGEGKLDLNNQYIYVAKLIPGSYLLELFNEDQKVIKLISKN